MLFATILKLLRDNSVDSRPVIPMDERPQWVISCEKIGFNAKRKPPDLFAYTVNQLVW